MNKAKPRRPLIGACAIIFPLVAAAYPLTSQAGAAEYTLHSFGSSHPEGGRPSHLVRGTDAHYYALTTAGIVKLAADGTTTLLARCTDYAYLCYATALVSSADGNLYVASPTDDGVRERGAVFRIGLDASSTLIYLFSELDASSINADGGFPVSLMGGPDGTLYGTTVYGGDTGFGTAFKIAPDGTFTVLHSFTDFYTLQTPFALDADGNLYGANDSSGGPSGSIFRITPAGSFSVFRSFGSADPKPLSGLTLGSDGNLYGVGGDQWGAWKLYRLAPDATLTVLHTADQPISGSYGASYNVDGTDPTVLIQGSDGNLYGTTQYGGVGDGGTVFRFTPDGSFSVLYSFSNYRKLSSVSAPDGASPGSLLDDGQGNLFVTTQTGGAGANIFCSGPQCYVPMGAFDKIVLQSALSASMSVEQPSIILGQATTVTWSSTNATSCKFVGTVYGKALGRQPLSGSVSITPSKAGTYVFALRCKDDSKGIADASAKLTVATPSAAVMASKMP